MRTDQHGFTLLELIITIAVAAVVLSIAVPSFTQMMYANRLSTTANAIVEALTLARLEAIRRNSATQFCSDSSSANSSDTLGSACGSQAGAAYALNNDNSTTRLQDAPSLPSEIQIASAVTALRYGGQGLGRLLTSTAPYSGLVADVFTDRLSNNNHRCIYITTGSIVSSCGFTSATEGCPQNEPADCSPL